MLAKAADKNSAAAELSAVSKWLAKPDSDGTLAKAVVAVYLKEVLQGKASGKKEKPVRLRRSSSSDGNGPEAAASSSSSFKAKKAKKRSKKNDKKEAKKMAKPGARQPADRKRKECKPDTKDAQRQGCLLEDSSQESPSNAALAAALYGWSAAECVAARDAWRDYAERLQSGGFGRVCGHGGYGAPTRPRSLWAAHPASAEPAACVCKGGSDLRVHGGSAAEADKLFNEAGA